MYVLSICVAVSDLTRKYVYYSVYLTHYLKQILVHCVTKGLRVGINAYAHHNICGTSDIRYAPVWCNTDVESLDICNRPFFIICDRGEVLIIFCSKRINHRLTNRQVTDKQSLSDHYFFERLNVTL